MSRISRIVTVAVSSAFVVAALAAASAAAAGQDLRSPDTRDAASALQARSFQDMRSPDARDAARPQVPASPAVAPTGGSAAQDRRDVGIVAGAMVTVVLASGGLSIVVRRRRTVQTSRIPVVSG